MSFLAVAGVSFLVFIGLIMIFGFAWWVFWNFAKGMKSGG